MVFINIKSSLKTAFQKNVKTLLFRHQNTQKENFNFLKISSKIVISLVWKKIINKIQFTLQIQNDDGFKVYNRIY